jgi:hypothetical protein
MDMLHKKVNSFESDLKKFSGMEAELLQVKNREKELQRIIDESKMESDSLRSKLVSGTSNEGSGRRFLRQPRCTVTRSRTWRSSWPSRTPR